MRLVLEFLTINGLIFAGSGLVNSSVLLWQIIVYLPYFVITWGWIFHRIDRIGQSQPGGILLLSDREPNHPLSAFDDYHASVTTILNRSKPTISGISRRGRVLVLIHPLMLMAPDAVAFTRLLQLARAAL